MHHTSDAFMPIAMGSGLQQPQAFHSLAAQFTFPPPAPTRDLQSKSAASTFQPSGSFQTFAREQHEAQYLDEAESHDASTSSIERHFESQTLQEASTSMEDDDENDEKQSMAAQGAASEPVTSPMIPPAQAPRVALDKLVGACTADIYLNMREVQHNHRPGYQPNSPYVKYRR